MDITIVVVRTKRANLLSSTFDFRDEYDILLLKGHRLPKVTIAGDRNHSLLTFVNDLAGLKGTRVLMIPTSENQINGKLCCIPIANNGFDYVDGGANFTSLFGIVTSPCIAVINHFKVWLYSRKSIAGSLAVLFSSNSDDRLLRSVTNPAHFFSQTECGGAGGGDEDCIGSLYANSIVGVAESRMAALDLCDRHIANNLFLDKLYYANKVDKYIVNKFYGIIVPDYTAIRGSVDYEIDPTNKRTARWCQDYPMHDHAHKGDTKAVRTLMLRGHSVLREDDDSWLPIHYAARYNHSECVQTLLSEGNCPPSLTTAAGSTALHLAARGACIDVVRVLLDHPNINVNIKDCNDNTPKTICNKLPSSEPHQQIVNLLLDSIKIYLIDDSHVTLTLDFGPETTVQNLHNQMLQVLDIGEDCGNIFAIWICSESLDLQLKREHRPLDHLEQWQKRTVLDLCDRPDAAAEVPRLRWRRDATRPLADDRRLASDDAVAVRLLFDEARRNVLTSRYPCSDADAIRLAAIVVRLLVAAQPRAAKAFLAKKENLQEILPSVKIRVKGHRLQSKVLDAYKTYCSDSSHKTDMDIHKDYLAICWNLIVYGSAIFTGHMQNRQNIRTFEAVRILVNDVGIHIVNCTSQKMVHSLKYGKIECTYITNRSCPIFEIRSKIVIVILSRQAQLIHFLAEKFAHMLIYA